MRKEIGDTVTVPDHLPTWCPDPRISSEDPLLGVSRLKHDIDPPCSGVVIEHPGLVNVIRRRFSLGKPADHTAAGSMGNQRMEM